MRSLIFILSRSFHVFFSIGGTCRYSPTCSQYLAESIIKEGFFRGTFLGMKRLMTCHPFSRVNGATR